MRTSRHLALGLSALLCVAALAVAAPAFAQLSQGKLTTFTGTSTSTGTWSRTIDDTGPNGANGPQAVHIINVSYGPGTTTAAQLALAYRDAARAQLPNPVNNPNGYFAQIENTVNPTVRVTKQSGLYQITGDTGFPPGMTKIDVIPSNAEHAPALSPGMLASLAGSLTALAWWARRRRRPE